MARFVYYNNNPYGDKEEDCVTRAITLATGIPYRQVARDLTQSADMCSCDRLYLGCYSNLLDKVYRLPRVNCKGMTVEEFADKNPYGIYLVRMNGHITCVISDIIFDIWDCRKEIVTNAWLVN